MNLVGVTKQIAPLTSLLLPRALADTNTANDRRNPMEGTALL